MTWRLAAGGPPLPAVAPSLAMMASQRPMPCCLLQG
jgi:hypothetical protein